MARMKCSESRSSTKYTPFVSHLAASPESSTIEDENSLSLQPWLAGLMMREKLLSLSPGTD